MGQLIDKTVLRKELSKLPSEMGFVRKSDVMQILGSQKCAYDVGKVVEQLECNDCERCLFCETCAGSKYCEDCHDKIINIVKKGGLETE